MKSKLHRILFTQLVGSSSLVCFAQRYPIEVHLALTPPYSLKLSDYVKPGSQLLVVSIVVNDVSVASLPARLHVKIETSAGVSIETLPTIAVTPIYLTGGEVNILFGDDLTDYFNINNLLLRGYSKEDYRRTGQLPEGYYRFTVEVRHFTTGRLISGQGTATAWIALGKPPQLKIPEEGAELGQIAGMPLTFSWLPSSVGIPSGGLEYAFGLWEMRIPGIDPYVVTASMPTIYSTMQTSASLLVHPAELTLEPGMKCAGAVFQPAPRGVDAVRGGDGGRGREKE
jgi:hypothetical protein